MTNSFMNKVAAERRVLSIVNTCFQGGVQLSGLSKSAIDLWQRTVGAQATDQVIESLLVLAELCQSLSDRSHESFKPLNPSVEESLEKELVALSGFLDQSRHKR